MSKSKVHRDSNKMLHREDGPAVEHPDGRKEWWIHGIPHRVDGPAIEHADGVKGWFIHGERHRIDGPAVEWFNGARSYYLNGKEYSYELWNRLRKLQVFS